MYNPATVKRRFARRFCSKSVLAGATEDPPRGFRAGATGGGPTRPRVSTAGRTALVHCSRNAAGGDVMPSMPGVMHATRLQPAGLHVTAPEPLLMRPLRALARPMVQLCLAPAAAVPGLGQPTPGKAVKAQAQGASHRVTGVPGRLSVGGTTPVGVNRADDHVRAACGSAPR